MMLLKPVLQLRHVAMATAELAATQWWYTSTLGCDSAWLGERERERETGITSAVTGENHHGAESDFFLLRIWRLCLM